MEDKTSRLIEEIREYLKVNGVLTSSEQDYIIEGILREGLNKLKYGSSPQENFNLENNSKSFNEIAVEQVGKSSPQVETKVQEETKVSVRKVKVNKIKSSTNASN